MNNPDEGLCSVCRHAFPLVPAAWHALRDDGDTAAASSSDRFCQRCFAADRPRERILSFGVAGKRSALLSKWVAEGFGAHVMADAERALLYVLETQLDAHTARLMREALPPDVAVDADTLVARMAVDYRTSDCLYEMGARAFAEEMSVWYALSAGASAN